MFENLTALGLVHGVVELRGITIRDTQDEGVFTIREGVRGPLAWDELNGVKGFKCITTLLTILLPPL